MSGWQGYTEAERRLLDQLIELERSDERLDPDSTRCPDCGVPIGWTLDSDDRGRWNPAFEFEGVIRCEDCSIDELLP